MLYRDKQQWTNIRNRVLVEGASRRRVIREEKISHATLMKMVANPTPPSPVRGQRARRKIGPYLRTIADHATARMAQRAIKLKDAELMRLIGTEVDDGYLVRAKDCQEVEREVKRFLDRVWRLEGKRLVIADGRILTAYHASRRYQRRLLRNAPERDL